MRYKFPIIEGIVNGISKIYYESGELETEVSFKDDKAISGFIYAKDGSKRKITDEHLLIINK